MRCGRLGDDLDSVGEFHTCDQLWQLVVTVEAAPALLRGSLKTIASAVLLERQPFARMVRCRTVANVLSIGFVTGMRTAAPFVPAAII